jgi:hypothetical protein
MTPSLTNTVEDFCRNLQNPQRFSSQDMDRLYLVAYQFIKDQDNDIGSIQKYLDIYLRQYFHTQAQNYPALNITHVVQKCMRHIQDMVKTLNKANRNNHLILI